MAPWDENANYDTPVETRFVNLAVGNVVAAANPRRVCLIFSIRPGFSASISQADNAPGNQGITLGGTPSYAILTQKDHGVLVARPWVVTAVSGVNIGWTTIEMMLRQWPMVDPMEEIANAARMQSTNGRTLPRSGLGSLPNPIRSRVSRALRGLWYALPGLRSDVEGSTSNGDSD